jgi:hypothetical protein
MLGMLVSESLWNGHVWWEVPNLLGSTFYGTRALRSGTALSILAGIALHFVITGTLGGLWRNSPARKAGSAGGAGCRGMV